MQEFDFLLLTKVLSLIFLLVNVILIIKGIIIRSDRQKKSASNTETHGVYLIDFMFFFGAVLSLPFSCLCCLSAFVFNSLEACLTFGLISILSLILLIAWENCYIIYDETGFTQKMFIGHKRYFTYDQITSYNGDFRYGDVNIYANGKRIFIDRFAGGTYDFYKIVKKRYRAAHNGKSIPVSKSRLDIYNGHIRSPGECIFVYLLLFVIIIAMLIFTIFNIFSVSYSEENTEQHILSFASCEADGDDLRLFPSDGGDCYVIYSYKEYVKDIDSLNLNCDGKSEFVARTIRVTPKNQSPYYRVCKLSSGDRTYYNFDDAKHSDQTNSFYGVIMFSAWLVIWIAFVVLSIIAGRNPKKHPRLVRMMFKKSYIIE